MLELEDGKREEARHWVAFTAKNFLVDAYIQSLAPTAHEVRKNLQRISAVALSLRELLLDADDFTLGALTRDAEKIGSSPQGDPSDKTELPRALVEWPTLPGEADRDPSITKRIGILRNLAQPPALPLRAYAGPPIPMPPPPLPANADRDPSLENLPAVLDSKDFGWLGCLAALSELAALVSDDFAAKSGRGNLYQRRRSADQGLVRTCLNIFRNYRPNEATGYGDGPFCLFVKEVYEFATGGDPPAPTTLLRLAKVAVRERRRITARTEPSPSERGDKGNVGPEEAP